MLSLTTIKSLGSVPALLSAYTCCLLAALCMASREVSRKARYYM